MIAGIFLDEWGMVLKPPLLGNPKLMMGIWKSQTGILDWYPSQNLEKCMLWPWQIQLVKLQPLRLKSIVSNHFRYRRKIFPMGQVWKSNAPDDLILTTPPQYIRGPKKNRSTTKPRFLILLNDLIGERDCPGNTHMKSLWCARILTDIHVISIYIYI